MAAEVPAATIRQQFPPRTRRPHCPGDMVEFTNESTFRQAERLILISTNGGIVDQDVCPPSSSCRRAGLMLEPHRRKIAALACRGGHKGERPGAGCFGRAYGCAQVRPGIPRDNAETWLGGKALDRKSTRLNSSHVEISYA